MILPVEGSLVTVVDENRDLWRMRVQSLGDAPSFKIVAVARTEYGHSREDHFAEIYPKDEGVSWARGWEGEDVEALKVATELL